MNLMFSLMLPLLEMILKACLFIIVVISPILVSILVHYLIYLKKGYRMKKRFIVNTEHKSSFFHRLLIEFPNRFVLDLFNKNPNEFNYYGFWLFAGEQGSGKTIAVTEFLRRIKKEFPMANIKSNIEVLYSDDYIDDFNDIVFQSNGDDGEVDFIDEIQNWFSSSERCTFPPDVIQEICQQRKQHKMMIGTSQCFNRVSLPLRQQVNYLCLPITIAGCLTIVRIYKPKVREDGKIIKKRHFKTYFFVHDDELRNSYNTYEKVKRLSLKTYKEKKEQKEQ